MKIPKSGLKLNKKKYQISIKSIVFLGHILSEGVIVEQKLRQSQKCDYQTANELQQFVGMISYLGKFIPNFIEVTSPLLTLLKKELGFKLKKPQLDAI